MSRVPGRRMQITGGIQ